MFEGFDGWLEVKDNPKRPVEEKPLSVSEFIAECNVMLEADFDDVLIEGEVASFKVNQNKWVFFDLKEGDSSLNCFLPLRQLGVALSDGMKVRVRACPKVTRWGRFSVTVRQILPVGEGNIRKSFELLKKKLASEGLFSPERKRSLPKDFTKLGVISSTAAAGYLDFLKIISSRWGGLRIQVVNTQVQGLAAASQIIRAIEYFNQYTDVAVIAILRGGGSADDLAAFNDENLARAIAASHIPIITGIGHEVDESLADLAADVRASTPSNAAELLTPDRESALRETFARIAEIRRFLLGYIEKTKSEVSDCLVSAKEEIAHHIELALCDVKERQKLLDSLNPETVLRRGYAIITQKNPPSPDMQNFDEFIRGDLLEITTSTKILTTEVKNVQNRN